MAWKQGGVGTQSPVTGAGAIQQRLPFRGIQVPCQVDKKYCSYRTLKKPTQSPSTPSTQLYTPATHPPTLLTM